MSDFVVEMLIFMHLWYNDNEKKSYFDYYYDSYLFMGSWFSTLRLYPFYLIFFFLLFDYGYIDGGFNGMTYALNIY